MMKVLQSRDWREVIKDAVKEEVDYSNKFCSWGNHTIQTTWTDWSDNGGDGFVNEARDLVNQLRNLGSSIVLKQWRNYLWRKMMTYLKLESTFQSGKIREGRSKGTIVEERKLIKKFVLWMKDNERVTTMSERERNGVYILWK